MRLPIIAQKLIREYAKPLTRPDWRKGTQHAQIFKYSPIFIDIRESFKNVSEYYKINYNMYLMKRLHICCIQPHLMK